MSDNNNSIAGSANRPIGNIRMFLEDIRARGFIPRGIIDVGANRGDWTRMALSVFPETKVVMIEPQQEMQQYLNQLCRENSDLEVIQAGAGREEGELVQTIWEDLAGSSFLPETSEEKLRDGTQRVTPIVTIDKVVKDRSYFFPDLVTSHSLIFMVVFENWQPIGNRYLARNPISSGFSTEDLKVA